MVSASSLLLASIALAARPANAFTSVSNHRLVSSSSLNAVDDASAKVLSDYMAKSHEEKLKAVKDVEEKKNSEIALLKAEIEQFKTSSALATTTPAAPPPAAPLATTTSSEAEAKLASYQSFMAEYIVNAQTQKLLAVKEAELKAEQKFQARLDKLFEAGGMALPAAAAAVVEEAAAAPVVEETSFQSRNAQIIAAGAAGKSRWGSMEIDRAIAEQKNQPVAAASTATSEVSSMPPSSFESRNAQVVAAGAAGKSRWGDMEVERVVKNGAVAAAPAAAVVVEEEKEVAPVSLEDRVNLGARLMAA
mmetsp:Transcript_13186/g.20697  ORF Transcript_13186/g.20697 Transcript_13186/m.20697 type:complete len:305 (-) Transcript_13186:288-1202(-)